MSLIPSNRVAGRCTTALVVLAATIGGFLPVVLLAATAERQNRSAPTVGTATLSGRVLDPDSEAPLAGVRMALWCSKCSTPLRETFTGSDGAFQFPSVPADTYQVAASKPGWLTTRFGQTKPQRSGTSIVLADRESRSGLTIRLLRGGVIDGRIAGENGEPLAGVLIQAYRMRYTPTGQAFDAIDSARTDDQGHYRIFSLAPGEYIVRAQPPRLQTVSVDAVQPVPDGGYVSTYFPGVPTIVQAGRLAVGAGEAKLGVDLNLSFTPLRKVSGRLQSSGAVFGKTSFFRLDDSAMLRSLEPVLAAGRPDGRFQIADVSPGAFAFIVRAYPLRSAEDASANISDGMLWGVARLVVGKDDLADVTVQLAPGATVSGQVKLANSTTLSLPKDALIALLPAGPTTLPEGELLAGRVGQDGHFAIGGIPPGTFHMAVRNVATPWVTESITASGRDVLLGSLEVSTADISAVTVTLTDRPATLRGSLAVPGGTEVTDYTVVAFPADAVLREARPRGVFASRLRTDGTFSLPVVPGAYLVALVADIEDFAWFDPKVLEPLVGGATSAIVQSGESKVLNLRFR